MFVALDGIHSALKKGDNLPPVHGENPFVLKIEECGLLDRIEDLQDHSNQQLYEKACDILRTYFQSSDQDVDDNGDSPVAATGQPSYEELFNV